MTYDALIDQLGDPSPEVRETVAWSLGQLAYREAGRRLSKLLRSDPCEFVRIAAAQALGEIRDPGTLPALVAALEDPDALVRIASVSALGKAADLRAVDPLKAALEREENAPLREHLLRVLYRLTGVVHRYLTAEEKKIEKYMKEVQASPTSGPAHYNLAVAFFHNRQYRLAREHGEQARQLGMGIGWLKARLDELPAEAFREEPPPSPTGGTGGGQDGPPGADEALGEVADAPDRLEEDE